MRLDIVNFIDTKKYNTLSYNVKFKNQIDDSTSNNISKKLTELFLENHIIIGEAWGLDFTKGSLHIEDSSLLPSEIINKFIEFYENIEYEITLIQINDTGNL